MPKAGQKENKEERRQAYRAWLELHPDLWKDWAESNEVERDLIRQCIVMEMKKDFVLAENTNWRDVRSLSGILNVLSEEE